MAARRSPRKVKVPLYNAQNKAALIDEGATVGATIGTDLFYADGTVVTLANLAAALAIAATAAGGGGSAGSLPLARTIWSLIAEIPPNVTEVAELATVGLVVRQTGGNWLTRSIAVADTGRLTVATADGDAGNPTLDMADIAAASVWGRSANSIGKPAAIASASDDTVVRRTGATINFGQLTSGMFPALVVPDAALSANVALLNRDPQTFSGQNVFTKAATGVIGGINLESIFPALVFRETDGAANNRYWRIGVNGEDFGFGVMDDTGTAVNILLVSRTANTIDSITFNGVTVNITGATSSTTVPPLRVGPAGTATTLAANISALSSAATSLALRNTGASIEAFMQAGSGQVFIGSITSTDVVLRTNNTDRVTIDASTGIATFTGNNGTDAVTVSGTTPIIKLIDTDAAADNRRWRIQGNAEQFSLVAINDAESVATIFFEVQRTGTTVDSITCTATTFAFASTNATANGQWEFSKVGSGSTAAVLVNSAVPGYAFRESDEAVDGRYWDIVVEAGLFRMRLLNDAQSFAPPFLTVQRSGTTISSLNLFAQALLFSTSGVSQMSIDSTGLIYFTGDVDNQLRFIAGATGSNRATYMTWYKTGGSTRRGFFGYTSTGSNVMQLANEESASISITPKDGMSTSIGQSVVSSAFQTSNRGVLVVVGATDALLDWKVTAGTTYGYVYAISGEFRINAYTSTPLTIYTNNTLYVTISTAGAQRWHAYGAGTLTTDASGNITAVSDERIKTQIRSFRRGLEAIRRIDPITFRYTKASGMDRSMRYAGLSAQNVRRAIPEAVHVRRGKMMSMSDRPILAALVNAVRELSAKIDDLEERIAA